MMWRSEKEVIVISQSVAFCVLPYEFALYGMFRLACVEQATHPFLFGGTLIHCTRLRESASREILVCVCIEQTPLSQYSYLESTSGCFT